MLKIILLSILLSEIFTLERDNYRRLEEWGVKNNVVINSKIDLVFNSLNDKFYVATQDIVKGESLLAVPRDLIIDYEKIHKYASKKGKIFYEKVREQFEDYFSMKGASNDPKKFRIRADQVILAIAEYTALVEDKGKLLKFYEPYFSMYETNVDNYPMFYNFDQMFLLQNTSLGSLAQYQKQALDEEMKMLNEYENTFFIQEEYYKSRTLTSKKAFKVDDRIALIPFSDLFERDPVANNSMYSYDMGNKVFYINATTNIKKGSKIKLYIPMMSNSDYLIFYGRTYKGASEPKRLMVPLFHLDFLPKFKLKDDDFKEFEYQFDLIDDKFLDKTKEAYKKLCRLTGKNEDDICAVSYMHDNLELYLDAYSYIYKHPRFHTIFKGDDLKNFLTVIEMETKLLKERLMQCDDVKSALEDIQAKKQAEYDAMEAANTNKEDNDL